MRRSILKCAKTVSVISVPVNLGQPFMGPDRAPHLLKENGLNSVLANCGWRVITEPDIFPKEISRVEMKSNEITETLLNAKNCHEVGLVCKTIFDKVKSHAETDNFILILGGDHCIPIGTIPGIVSARKNTGVVWVDAHADINTPLSSGSGNFALNRINYVA